MADTAPTARGVLRAVYVDVDEMGTDPGRSLLEGAGFDVFEAHCRSTGELIAAAAGAAALLVGCARVTREVLAALPSVGIVSTLSVGTDHIDLDAARDLGVWVCNVTDAGTDEVATHALAMALALVRHLPFYDRIVRGGGWTPAGGGAGTGTAMRRPTDMTLGIVGMGRIGRRTAELAQTVFRRIIGCDPLVPASSWPLAVKRAELDHVLAHSDVLSLHLPLTDDTRRLIDGDRLGTMKAGSYLVNVSRGELVDMDALVEALDAGWLRGAALDVLPEEPPDPDDPILRHPRLLVTPHVAFLSEESSAEYLRQQALNVVAWVATGRPDRVVLEPPRPRARPA